MVSHGWLQNSTPRKFLPPSNFGWIHLTASSWVATRPNEHDLAATQTRISTNSSKTLHGKVSQKNISVDDTHIFSQSIQIWRVRTAFLCSLMVLQHLRDKTVWLYGMAMTETIFQWRNRLGTPSTSMFHVPATTGSFFLNQCESQVCGPIFVISRVSSYFTKLFRSQTLEHQHQIWQCQPAVAWQRCLVVLLFLTI